MNTEDLFIDHSGYGKAVEAVGESLPELSVVTALAFIVETINTIDRSTFVITTKKEKVLGELNLISKKKTNSFKRLLSTINIVAKE